MEDYKSQDMFYPGSHERLSDGTGEGAAKTGSLDPLAGIGPPTILSLGGVKTEFYTVGQLARALNRKAGTIRKLEDEKNLPRPIWRKPALDDRMRRRLYTRAQIEGLRQIALEEGILTDTSKKISNTHFTERAFALFAEGK